MMLSNGKVAPMTDKKLTDNEIVKALECCKQEIDDNGVICGECKKCPNYDGKTGLCKEDLPTFTLDLINRLQADCENYKKIAEHQQSVTMDRGFEIERLKEKIESLQGKNERLKKSNEMFADIGKMYSEIKSEAYKEFAERLKEKSWDVPYETKNAHFVQVVDVEDIDNLLKELVGEDNG